MEVDATALSNARTYGRDLGIEIVRGSGARVQTVDGRWLLDCLSGAGSASLGHGHPVVRQAIERVLGSGLPLQLLDFDNPELERFVRELDLSLPEPMRGNSVVHLCPPSGSAAIEAALTAAEWSTGRTGHVGVVGGFHGCTAAAREVSSSPSLYLRSSRRRSGDLLALDSTRVPAFGHPAEAGETSPAALLDRVAPASVVFEAVQGEAGCLTATPKWLKEVRQATSERGVMLIADEIQCGAGRTGRMWGFEHSDIIPDVFVASKGLGAGMPIAAVVLDRRFDTWIEGAFTGTFRGSVLGFAVAAAFLEFVRTEALLSRVGDAGWSLLKELDDALCDHPAVARIDGIGLMIAVEICDPAHPTDPAAARRLAIELQRALLEHGVLIERGGLASNVLRLLPPLTVEDPDLEEVVTRVVTVIRSATIGSERRRPPGHRSAGYHRDMDVEFREASVDRGVGERLVSRMADEMEDLYDGLDIAGPGMPAAGPAELGPPRGLFLVGFVNGDPVCCGGFKALPDGGCEIKRMFVVKEHRRHGLARELLGELERRAYSMGYRIARLGTGPRQQHARELYESVGYMPVGNFSNNPVATYFGEKKLAPTRDGSVL